MLPLPLLLEWLEEAIQNDSRLSRSRIRRIQRRVHVQKEANSIIKSLNSLYTGGRFSGSTSRVSDLESLPLAQQLAIKHNYPAKSPGFWSTAGACFYCRSLGSAPHR